MPGSPPTQGLAVAGLLAALAWACEAWTRGPLGMGAAGAHDRYMLLLFPALIGYVVAIVPYGVREALRDLSALRPILLGREIEGAPIECHLDHHPLWMLLGAVGCGLIVSVVSQEVVAQRLSRLFTGPGVAPRDVVLLILSMGFWVSVLSGFAVVVANALFFARVGDQFVRVNLLRPALMRPFARVGLRYVGIITGLLAIVFFLAALASEPILRGEILGREGLAGFAMSAGFSLLVGLLAASIALVLPSLGIHRAMLREKARLLEEIDERIGDHGRLLPPVASATSGEIKETLELLALRERVASLSTWPFDAFTRVRFAGFTLLPAASWMGSGLLERLVVGI